MEIVFQDQNALLTKKLLVSFDTQKTIKSEKHVSYGLDGIANDECMVCLRIEDDEHMLFSCEHKVDVRYKVFNLYIGSLKEVNIHQLYKNISTLNLDLYTILNLDLKINIFDIFAITLKHIWRSWMFFYEHVPLDSDIIFDQIKKEIMKLSSFKKNY